jgi:endonuclease/exonuclease/phosphatase family metal-dependent hydrolase
MDMASADQRSSYVFEGNSQILDHILVSQHLVGAATFEPVHVNAEFWDQASDHDPGLTRLSIVDHRPARGEPPLNLIPAWG